MFLYSFIIGLIVLFGGSYVLYEMSVHHEANRRYPTADDWLRMKSEPGWSRQKQNELDQQEYEQQLKDYMQRDLTKTYQDYL